MFSALKSLFFAVLIGSIVGHAAPLDKRQIGDLQCNLDRAGIVAALFEMKGTLNAISSQTKSDATNAAFANQAQSGLSAANGGVETIAAALLTGQKAPASARTQVEQGLTTMSFALGNITSSDSSTMSTVGMAQSQLAAASKAGNGVLANCN